MKKAYDVTVAGHICLDIIPKFADTGLRDIASLFVPGKLINVGAAKISTGGPVSNTGIAMKKLGLNVAFMARVGEDEFGRLVVRLLEAQGSTDGVSMSSEDRTSYTVALAPPGIDRIFLHDPGANDRFSGRELDADIIAQSRLFHFGYPPLMAACYEREGEELAHIFQLAKRAGAITSLDMSLPDPNNPSGKAPWKKILESVLPHVDIFLPSIEEVFFMLDSSRYFRIKEQFGAQDVIDYFQPEDFRRLAERCLDLGCAIVALKTAHRGFYIRTADVAKHAAFERLNGFDANGWSDREVWCPAYRIERIASATGSGDSSIAGFLTALIRGQSIETALQCANCVGFQNLHELDAISGIKTWDETIAMIRDKSMKRIDPSLPADSWTWDEQKKVWFGNKDLSK
ncbi:MAG: carbohydrate kinase family protein [Candidatus Zhuqueibacterota bacterium]